MNCSRVRSMLFDSARQMVMYILKLNIIVKLSKPIDGADSYIKTEMNNPNLKGYYYIGKPMRAVRPNVMHIQRVQEADPLKYQISEMFSIVMIVKHS